MFCFRFVVGKDCENDVFDLYEFFFVCASNSAVVLLVCFVLEGNCNDILCMI